MSKIKHWKKGSGSYIIDEISTPNSVLKSINTGKKVLQCTTAGTIALQSKQAYGEWEFDVYKDSLDYDISFISQDIIDAVNGSNYHFRIATATNNRFELQKRVSGAYTLLFKSPENYLDDDTWYKLKVARLQSEGTFKSIIPSMTIVYPADTFAVFIKGGDFGNDWTLVDTTGGSGTNPVKDSTYKTSNYFVADLDAGDRLANLKIYDGVKQ